MTRPINVLSFLAASFVCLLLRFEPLLASEVTGTYSADPSRFLKVTSVTNDSIDFVLSVGVAEADSDTECFEGDVSCLTVEGVARRDAGGFVYVDPEDPESRLTFSLGPSSADIVAAKGRLGTGTGNQHHLGEIAGHYSLMSTSAQADAPKPPPIFFRTPSRNISCVIWNGDDASVRCDIGQMTPTYTKRPHDCDLDWGNAFGITANGLKGELICYGDAVYDPNVITLGYGEIIEQSGLKCKSEKTGLTCENGLGHGFFLSKLRQKVF